MRARHRVLTVAALATAALTVPVLTAAPATAQPAPALDLSIPRRAPDGPPIRIRAYLEPLAPDGPPIRVLIGESRRPTD